MTLQMNVKKYYFNKNVRLQVSMAVANNYTIDITKTHLDLTKTLATKRFQLSRMQPRRCRKRASL